ncbi:MAG: hypothetical protein JW963_01850 [Anaerolineales bacterium]|nr:hypothetical protein [Anaerolineales bacterium]
MAKVFGTLSIMDARMISSADASIAKRKLASGLSRILAMIMGIVNTKRLRPAANSRGVSMKRNANRRNIKKNVADIHPGHKGLRFTP